jgi:hypothetical protein
MPQGKKVTVVKICSQLIHKFLTKAGSDDVFLMEYDSSGNLVWVKQAGNIKRAHPHTAAERRIHATATRAI